MGILGLFSRRNALLGIGAAAATTAASGGAAGSALAQVGGRRLLALQSAGYADWLAQVGSNFTTHTGHVLRLVEVRAYATQARAAPRPAGVRNPGFAARFDIVRGGAISEGLYLVAHPRSETFEIFLSKGGPNMPRRMLADFN